MIIIFEASELELKVICAFLFHVEININAFILNY